ncbi:hypothetical protein PF010_g29861 [Phytophthora fragariae]|uniref:Uncharacterized protein n=1 Tax=Phytophthora fragariae TaxID=53985 RepID=A0A6A3QP08_9STRA|nr:hypothetical protein PF010_g29861 [Phytophthora fragariae]KAE9080373.1 hypothetical protein PF006_g27327 [Phytophthora fragariae]
MTKTKRRTKRWRTILRLLLKSTTQLLRLPPLLRLLGEELNGFASLLPGRRPKRLGRLRRLRKISLRRSSLLRPSRFCPSQPRTSRHPLSQLRTNQRPPSRPRQSQRRPSLLRPSQRPPSRLWLKLLSRVQHHPASRLAVPPALIFLTY